jgi:hypothetical protein
VSLSAFGFSAIGIISMFLGIFDNLADKTSIVSGPVPIGIAYFAIGLSLWATWINLDIAEDSETITMNAIVMMFEETHKKMDENKRINQGLLNKLRAESE